MYIFESWNSCPEMSYASRVEKKLPDKNIPQCSIILPSGQQILNV